MLDATSSEVVPAESVHGVSKEEYRRMKQWLDDRIEASKKKKSAEVGVLTPCLAQLALQRNPINRRILKTNALALASDIASSRFVFNGASIVFAKTGVLNDGQHRCQQVIATGKSIETVFVFGADESARFTNDTGKSKTASNLLHMKGRKYSTILAAVVNYYLQWQEAGYIAYGGGAHVPTKKQIVDAAEEMQGVDKSIEFTTDAMKTVRSHAVMAFCHYVFKRRAGVDAADEFIQKLIDGDGLRKGDPIHYCRNRLLGMNRGYTSNDRAELIFKCWNKWRNGGTVATFRFTGGKLPKVEK